MSKRNEPNPSERDVNGMAWPFVWDVMALCLGRHGPLSGTSWPLVWDIMAPCLGRHGPFSGTSWPLVWDVMALCLGRHGLLSGTCMEMLLSGARFESFLVSGGCVCWNASG